MKVFTIGFTKKTAQQFFELIKSHDIDLLVDIRLNNTSQLAGFAKCPDLPYFLHHLSGCAYTYEELLSPKESMMKEYKSKLINWAEFSCLYAALMQERGVREHLKAHYREHQSGNICLLCSEDHAEHCHRSLAASLFAELFDGDVEHL